MKKSADQKKNLEDQAAKKKKRVGGLEKRRPTLRRDQENVERRARPGHDQKSQQRDEGCSGQRYRRYLTAEASLPLNEDNDDGPDAVTPRRGPTEAQTSPSASHREALSGKEPSGRTLKTVAELDKEATELSAKKEYEIYGMGKAEAVGEQRRTEEQQKAFSKIERGKKHVSTKRVTPSNAFDYARTTRPLTSTSKVLSSYGSATGSSRTLATTRS